MKFIGPISLSVLSFILSISILTQDLWPQFLSRQNKIDPAFISEEYDLSPGLAYFDNLPVSVPQYELSQVLGDTVNQNHSNKRIEVNLTTQTASAYEDDQLINQFTISSGKWGRTHPGTYNIWAKVISQKMSGGSKELGTYYYLPNVPYIMFFYNQSHPKSMGYSFHGTYWHNNFGVPMSHGCVNMKTDEAAVLYNWADIGTTVIIYGKYQYPQASR